MKTLHSFLFLFVIAHCIPAYSHDTLKPKLIAVPANPCNSFVKENIGDRRAISYTHLREGDVMWEKRVWREIDMREKQNQPLYFPLDYNPCRSSLMQALATHILNEDIIAFKDDQFMVPYNLNEIKNLLIKRDTVEEIIYDPQGEQSTRLVPTVDSTSIYARVLKYTIKEDWFFDKQKSVMETRIVGIAASEYLEDKNLYRELFWVYFPACRPYFASTDVYNFKNDAERRSLDDVFWKRQFASRILKESNVYDRNIQEYQKGIDALLEADNIRMNIFKMEHDLWNH